MDGDAPVVGVGADLDVIDLRDAPDRAWAPRDRETILPPGAAVGSGTGRPPGMRQGRRILMVGAAVVVMLLVVVLAGQVLDLRGRLDGARRDDARRLASLQQEVDASRQEAAAAAAHAASLDGRVDGLATKAAASPDVAALAAGALPSVVVVEAATAQGSAWVVASGGGSATLVTAYHVVADTWKTGARTVLVRRLGATVTATLVAVDTADDLAALTVPQTWPALARSAVPAVVGDPVLVVGAPLGLDGTATSGIVSAVRTLDGRDYVQFSAASNPGSSGGPVLDRAGAVIGVDDSGYGPKDGAYGLSFAVPVGHVCAGLGVC